MRSYSCSWLYASRHDLHGGVGQLVRPALEEDAEQSLLGRHGSIERRPGDLQLLGGGRDRDGVVAALLEQLADRVGHRVEVDALPWAPSRAHELMARGLGLL